MTGLRAKLPKRRVLRSILHDAIEDRLALEDPSIAEEKAMEIDSYRRLLAELSENRPLPDGHRATLIRAASRAWTWRESFIDSVSGTGDNALITSAKADLDRVRRLLHALGMERTDPFEGARRLTLAELSTGSYGISIEGFRKDGRYTETVSWQGDLRGTVTAKDGDDGDCSARDAAGRTRSFPDFGAAREWLLAA